METRYAQAFCRKELYLGHNRSIQVRIPVMAVILMQNLMPVQVVPISMWSRNFKVSPLRLNPSYNETIRGIGSKEYRALGIANGTSTTN